MTVRTRFAPSPTGFMHVGNLRTALYAWLLARSGKGKFILRIEDTDQARFVENAVEVIYNTLASAGLDHDEGPDKDGGFGPYVQSERKNLYRPFAEELVKSGHAYYCFCEKSEEPTTEAGTTFIDGCPSRCVDLSPEEVQAKLDANIPYVIRQKIDRSGTVTFHDLVFGDITIEAKVLDDQILIKQDGMPTYNFANVIDDHLMQITHVVRGSEYLSSTPKYNLLYQAFGWDIPQYVHLPLIMGRDAEGNVSKLSKRHGSVSFENLVEEGFLPEAIINYIALLGWSSKTDREIFSLAELAELFSVDGLNKAAAIFDYDKLRWMNSEYIKQMNFEDFKAKSAKFAPAEFAKLEKVWDKVASLLQSRLENFTDIPSMVAFLIEQPAYEVELFNHKKNKATPESAKEIICDVMPEFEKCENWNAESLTAILMNYAQTRELKVGKVMWGVRIALSGQSVTPGGPGEIMEIIGREKSFARLNAALAKIG